MLKDSSQRKPVVKQRKRCQSCMQNIKIESTQCPYCRATVISPTEAKLASAISGVMPTQYPATKILLGTIIIWYVMVAFVTFQNASGGFTALQQVAIAPDFETLHLWGAQLRGHSELWPLVTANFMHIGLLHIFFNAYALWLIGPWVEKLFGVSIAFASFILLGTLAMLGSNQLGGTGIVAGASGSLMAMIGMVIAGAHRLKTVEGFKLRNQMLTWAGFVVVVGVVLTYANAMNVDNTGHIAGLVAGLIAGWFAPLLGLKGMKTPWPHRIAFVTAVASIGIAIAAVAMMLLHAQGTLPCDICFMMSIK